MSAVGLTMLGDATSDGCEGDSCDIPMPLEQTIVSSAVDSDSVARSAR